MWSRPLSGTITLNFVNRSQRIAAADVVICQHNAAAGLRCNPVAWRVLRAVTPQAAQALELPQCFAVSVEDVTGQVTPPRPVIAGHVYAASASPSGTVLAEGEVDIENRENVTVPNHLQEGVIHATAHKGGHLIAMRTNVAPGEVAAFRFFDHVYVALSGRVQEGEVISDAVASRITTRINLLGITSADVVLRDGAETDRFPVFELENIQC